MDLDRTLVSGHSPGDAPLAERRHHLVVVDGPDQGAWITATAELQTVGRAPGNDLRLHDPEVSGRHCAIVVEGGALRIDDLGSTNGTLVGGAAVDTARVAVGELVRVGLTTLRHEHCGDDDLARAGALAEDVRRARRYLISLIPQPIATAALAVDWHFEPTALLGGDGLGFVRLDDDHVALYVLDVSGHGVEAALHAASVLNVVRHGALPDTDMRRPADVLARLGATFPMEEHDGKLFAMWYGVHDRRSGRLAFASAGHPPALLARSDGTIERLATRNPPVGAWPGREIAADDTTVAPGDRLFVVSDGLLELTHRDGAAGVDAFVGLLTEALRSATLVPAALHHAARSATAAPIDDDVSILVASFAPPSDS